MTNKKEGVYLGRELVYPAFFLIKNIITIICLNFFYYICDSLTNKNYIMSKTNTVENPEMDEKELSPEEYAKAKAQAMEHLKGEVEFLEVEAKYHDLLAKIEESKLKRVMMIRQMAAIVAPSQEEEPSQEDQPKRTLKKK